MQDWLKEMLARVTSSSSAEAWKDNRRRKQAAGGVRQKVFSPKDRQRFEAIYGPSRWSVIDKGGIHYQFEGWEELE